MLIKNGETVFQPVTGLEEKILMEEKYPGRFYIAADTGRMYLDIDKDERVSVGGSGNGSALYQVDIASIPSDGLGHYIIQTNQISNETINFEIGDLIINSDGSFYKVSSILESDLVCEAISAGAGSSIWYSDAIEITLDGEDDYYHIPASTIVAPNAICKIDDLIIDAEKGNFYRIREIQNDEFLCTMLALAGGGSGDGPVSIRDVDLTWDSSTISMARTYVYGQSYNALFTPSTTAEGDSYCSLTFEIIDNQHGGESNIISVTVPKDTVYKFDTSKLPLSNDITLKVTVTSDNSQYNNGLGYQRIFSRIKTIAMSITKPQTDNYLPLIKPDDLSGNLLLKYMPNGDTSMAMQLHVYIDGLEDNSLKKNVPVDYYNKIANVSIPRQSHGVHTIELKLSVTINGDIFYSNGITYEGAWASEGEDTPIIWVGKYDKTIINYENSYIYYMVYDPQNYANGLPAEVHLQKDGKDISTVQAYYSDDNWLVWDISNAYEAVEKGEKENHFSITCRTESTNLDIIVTTEGSRELGLIDPNSLILNMSAAGRSSSEIKSERVVFNSTVNSDTVEVELKDFNWQNNGWKDSDGPDENGVDSGSYLSIANGAALNVGINKSGLSLNAAKNYSFEFRFRVRNVQEYSTLIRVIPKYFYVTENGDESSESLYEWEIEERGLEIAVDEYGNLRMDEENTVKQEDISSGVVVKWMNDAGLGFCIGTQEAFFKTPSGIANVRYCENEVINLTMVVSKSDSLCYIYLNGILSGAVALPTGSGASFIINSLFEFNSQYCDFDLYRFRIYELGLTMPQVIHNYLSDMHNIVLYDQNQITDPLDDYALSYKLLVEYNKNHPEAPSMPYATWTITDNETDELLPWKKGNNRVVTVEFVNPALDAALDEGKIDEWYYYTHCPSFIADGVDINVQGTSTQKYPRRNYKLKYKSAKKTWKFTKGSLAGKAIAENQVVLDKNGVEHQLSKKYHMDNEVIGINKFTWKIDYMESSGTYNTGFANLMGNLLHPLYTKHPLDDLNIDGLKTDALRTSVYGFPVLTFHKYADGEYEYIGKYNMNIDKSANEAYGFEDNTEHPYVDKRIRKVLNKETNEYEDEEYQPTIAEIAECWELCDNQGNWCSYKYPDAASREAGFGTLQEGTSGDSAKLEILNHYEYRYNFYEDQLDLAYEYTSFTDPNTQIEYTNNGQINNFLRERHSNLERLFNWLDSTDQDAATNVPLPAPVEYNVASTVDNDDSISYELISTGSWKATFTKDTREYRKQKFRAEFDQHLDKEYCLTYFVLTELLLCYDSRGKNCMMATFGPQRKGGEYIWYPIFYDIDTQLGLNNSGAYLWDYDADVTQDNLFSTPTSVLWVNLYNVFYDDIVQKYRVLRGVKIPSEQDKDINGSLTYRNIVGAYECTSAVFNSYAMAGVRPIVAVGLDEYYKYLAPALKESDYREGKKYAGYYDTSGSHLYQDTPTYVYACQGDKKLTTELLLRNRLNYIDSWWLGGDYIAGVVENQIFIRANANEHTTSDLFLDSASLSELPEGTASKGFSLAEYPKAYFDARPGAKIKPFLHQYVSYFMDQQPSVPVKYTGGTGQEDGVWTNVDNSKLMAFKTSPDLTQQITYIPGGDYISSLGDISLMYPNSLQIFHGQRLLDFKLGSDIPGYKNPLINSSSDFELTPPMPLLKTVNISKLNQFNRELNLTSSQKLQEFRALGSIIERINFAPGAPLHTVHLPSTMTTVSLVQHQDLTDILTSVPVVVELQSNGEYKYLDANSYRGLYIEGVTDYTADKAGTGHKLTNYEVSGGGLGYNSYRILKNLYDLKNGASSNKYLRAALTEVEWTPYEMVEFGTSYDRSITYYLLNDHSTFETFTFVNAEDWNNKLLNGLIFTYNEKYKGTDEEKTITDLSLLDNFIAAYELAEAAKTESQFANTSGSIYATVPTITGTLYVSNTEADEIPEAKLTSVYKKFFPQLTIYAKHIKEANLTKYVRVYESGKEEVLDIERTDGTTPLELQVAAPTQTNYDFKGWSTQNPNTTSSPVLALEYDSVTQTYTKTAAWNELSFNEETSVITMYAIFTIHEYEISYYYDDETLLQVVKVPFNEYVSIPSIIPYKDDKNLPFTETYKLLGYSRVKDTTDTNDLIPYRPEDNTKLNIKSLNNIKLYAIFKKDSVYNNVLSDDYFTVDEYTYYNSRDTEWSGTISGYRLRIKDDVSLSGKITLPNTYNGKDIIMINFSRTDGSTNQRNLTHVFWENPQTCNCVKIEASCFSQCQNLVYYEFTPKLRVIGSSSFNGCGKLTYPDFSGTSLFEIEGSAFNSALTASSDVGVFIIPGTVRRIAGDAFAFVNHTSDIQCLQFGSYQHPTYLTSSGLGNDCFFLTSNEYDPGNMYPDILSIRVYFDPSNPTDLIDSTKFVGKIKWNMANAPVNSVFVAKNAFAEE